MGDLKYNFLNNNFTTYKPSTLSEDEIKLEFPLITNISELEPYGIYNIQSFKKNNPIIKNNNSPKLINNNTEQIPYETSQQLNPSKVSILKSKDSETLSKIIDEVSNESEFNGLKDANIKKLIMLLALRESGFNPSATSNSSTAAGYFQFIDGTRKKFSNKSRKDFLNDPKEQVRAAYKYLINIHSMPEAKQLKLAGYNDAVITALGWWYPRSMLMVLDGNKNFSLGGYSIKRALEMYG